MRLETLLKRIGAKTNTPSDQLYKTEACMVWTGNHIRAGLKPKMVRDANYAPSLTPVMIRSSALMNYEGKQWYVPRLLHALELGHTNFKLTQLCSTTLCVNPQHWGVRLTTPEPPPLPEPFDEGWTLQEACDLLDSYLLRNPAPPLDPEHDLLVDIPRDLLIEALKLFNKEHMLP